MKAKHPPSATETLRRWLASLKEETLNPDVRIGMIEGLALSHRVPIKRMLDDIAVQEAVDRVCEPGNHDVSIEEKFDTVKSMLVDACWMQDFINAPKQENRSTSIRKDLVTRTEKIRSLTRAAEKAQKLAGEMLSLAPVTGPSLTVSHLQDRLAAGDEPWFIQKRKGWLSRRGPPDRSIADLLEMLTSELVEEAALIKMNIDKTAQPGHQKHHLPLSLTPSIGNPPGWVLALKLEYLALTSNWYMQC